MSDLFAAFTFIVAQENGGDGASGAGNYQVIIYIVLFVAIFYFLLIRPGQKQRKMHQELVQSIRKGDEIMTAGGIYGTVHGIEDDVVDVEVAKGTVIRLSRNSVSRRVSAEAVPDEEPEEEDASGAEETEEK